MNILRNEAQNMARVGEAPTTALLNEALKSCKNLNYMLHFPGEKKLSF